MNARRIFFVRDVCCSIVPYRRLRDKDSRNQTPGSRNRWFHIQIIRTQSSPYHERHVSRCA